MTNTNTHPASGMAIITRDGAPVAGPTFTALKVLHGLTSASADHALKHEGYAIRDETNTTPADWYRLRGALSRKAREAEGGSPILSLTAEELQGAAIESVLMDGPRDSDGFRAGDPLRALLPGDGLNRAPRYLTGVVRVITGAADDGAAWNIARCRAILRRWAVLNASK